MSASVTFAAATPADNGDILRLLRENAMQGRYALSLEREPDAFAEPAPSADRVYIVARAAATGEAIGLCERVVRPAFVNGEARLLPYLTALRVAKSHRNRISVLKGGFLALRERATPEGTLPFALTSIAAGNAPARRVLTAGIKGLPSYCPVGAYSTVVLRPRRHCVAGVVPAAAEDLPEIAGFLQRTLRPLQFAPVWDEETLRALEATFFVHRTGGRIDGCVSLWDQRAVRQAVVRDYPAAMRVLRPALNLLAPAAGLPALPPVGRPISQAFLSHLAARENDTELLLALVRAALDRAARRGLGAGIVGIARDHPLRRLLKAELRAIEYGSLLYLVHWPEGAAVAASCAAGLPMPDVGLL